jgi:hypothetical protein
MRNLQPGIHFKKLALPPARELLRLSGVVTALFLSACSSGALPSSSGQALSSGLAASDDEVVIQQIEAARTALADHSLPLSILSYQSDLPLNSDSDVTALEGSIADDQATVPQFDGRNTSSLSLRTVSELTNVRGNLEQMVFPLLKAGQKTLDITWSRSDGSEFHTKCVYDENGVVYDNVLSNLAFVEAAPPPVKKLAIEPQQTYAFTARALDYTITWIWGSTRGKITVDHTIIWNGSNHIYTQNGSADAWMTLGSAQAQTHNTQLDPSRYAVMAYGYAWATPTASFKISYDGGHAKFDVSLSGVGSKGGGDDHHTIYIP